ncbi:MAG: hypothetical protein GXY44_04660 [Phycisphaerales bacterium]|nr:hypothetical protein [Phycisphaerales bacterium]
MIEHNPDRRARTVALVGLVFEISLTIFYCLLLVGSQSQAMRGLCVLAALGCLIWLYLVLVYHQRVLVHDERLETEALRRERIDGHAIFEVEEEQLLMAWRRLKWMHRWMLPGFSIAIILLMGLDAIYLWSWSLGESIRSTGWPKIGGGNLLIWFVGGGAFLCFLFSRYAVGMARQREWRMLRAGAAWLMGLTIGSVALCLALAALYFADTPIYERILAYVLRILLLVLATEFTLNFVLDYYRPRSPDEEPRPPFDSRLLGLFTEPGGIARSIAEAINYQFGFEVSSTWFYKLLERSALPLIGFGVFTMFLASCVVIGDADGQVVVERFGKKRAVLPPGLHFKWPWPVEIATHVPTRRIHTLEAGDKPPPQDKKRQSELLLWTNEHEMEPHLNVLVATPKLAAFLNFDEPGEAIGISARADSSTPRSGRSSQAVAVSQLRVAGMLQYRIRDAYQWLRTFEDPVRMLKTIVEREITCHCASMDVLGLLGFQRGSLEQRIWSEIQRKADRAGLGVEVVFFGLLGVHPPIEADVAQAFQEVIGAEQQKEAAKRDADREWAQLLTMTAGSKEQAEELYGAIKAMNRTESDASSSEEERQAARNLVDRLFSGAEGAGVGGEAAGKIMQSRADRWQSENQAHGWAALFREEIKNKNAAPAAYRLRKYLATLAGATDAARKYIFAADGDLHTFNLNLQDSRTVGLDVLGEKE